MYRGIGMGRRGYRTPPLFTNMRGAKYVLPKKLQIYY